MAIVSDNRTFHMKVALVSPQNIPLVFILEPQLAQETATQKFVDYPDQLVRPATLAAV